MALEDEMLADALASVPSRHGPLGWIDRLSPEHRASVEAARVQWIGMGGAASGVPAIGMAASIAKHLVTLGYQMPRTKEIARWLVKN